MQIKSGHVKARGGASSEVPEHIYKYLAANFELEWWLAMWAVEKAYYTRISSCLSFTGSCF